jgi:hypothetical protein
MRTLTASDAKAPQAEAQLRRHPPGRLSDRLVRFRRRSRGKNGLSGNTSKPDIGAGLSCTRGDAFLELAAFESL